MTFFHCILDGVGTSGDGSTWNDDSSGTAAFIGMAGLDSAITAAANGDSVYVKNNDSTAVTFSPTNNPASAADNRNPIKIFAVEPGTTNLGASVVQADLIQGLATGGASRAYADANVPTITVTGGSSDITIQGSFYWYGFKFISEDNIVIGTTANRQIFEECHFEVTSSGDIVNLGASAATGFYKCKIVLATNADTTFGGVACFDCEFDAATDNVRGFSGPDSTFVGCDMSLGAATRIWNQDAGTTMPQAMALMLGCQFPSSYVFRGGTRAQYGNEFRAVSQQGCGVATTLTTGQSEQNFDAQDEQGVCAPETTKIRTGGADDGASGGFSWDMTPLGALVPGIRSMFSPWMYVWVKGNGTSKTLTVYVASDSGNTETGDWQNHQLWMEYTYPSASGNSKWDWGTARMGLLDATPVDVPDDTVSTWGAGTQNPQKIQATIAPDYEGYAMVRVHFAPEQADTIYVDPNPGIL